MRLIPYQARTSLKLSHVNISPNTNWIGRKGDVFIVA